MIRKTFTAIAIFTALIVIAAACMSVGVGYACDSAGCNGG